MSFVFLQCAHMHGHGKGKRHPTGLRAGQWTGGGGSGGRESFGSLPSVVPELRRRALMETSKRRCSVHPAHMLAPLPTLLTTLALTGFRPSVMSPAHTACLRISLSFYLKFTRSFIPHIGCLPWTAPRSPCRGFCSSQCTRHFLTCTVSFPPSRIKHLEAGRSLYTFKLSTAPSPVQHSANI